MTDEQLREALIQYQDFVLEYVTNKLSEQNLGYHEFSPKFHKRMQRNINRCIRRDKVRRIIRKLKKVLL